MRFDQGSEVGGPGSELDELASLGAEDVDESVSFSDDGDGEPIAEAEDTTDSRPVGKTEQGKGIDLSTLPEFRRWQAEQDRKLQQIQQQARDAERRASELEEQQYRLQTQALAAQIDQVGDPAQRQQLIDQIADYRGYSRFQQWRGWASQVEEKARAAGLDPSEFDPGKYSGSDGKQKFEYDLAVRRAEKLEADNKRLQQQASPESIEKLVRQALARQGYMSGVDSVDAGTPGRNASQSDWERDKKLFNSGRMSASEFTKKYGG